LNIAQVLHISVNWIMGKDIYPEEESLLLDNYRQCGIHGRNYIQQIAKYEAIITMEEKSVQGMHRIPCLLPDNQICDGSVYKVIKTKYLCTNNPNAFMALLVPNNLWVPRYCKQDIILLKNCFPMSGEEALFIYQGKVYYRKYMENNNTHILRCINERYPDLIFQRMDDQSLLCIGTATGVIRT